jgi:rhodanese-related sulfurtransferase
MTLPIIPAEAAATMLHEGGALLVDVREADERARLHVAGSAHLPLSRLAEAELPLPSGRAVLFHCASGARTTAHAPALGARAAGVEAFIVAGGIEALRRAGVAVAENRKAPLPLMRQVQIVAGSLALAGAVLGVLVHPGFHAVSGVVGAGLAMAGITGFCPMANALALMPWNRRAA